MDTSLIITLITASAPAITAIAGCAVSFVKSKKFLNKNVIDKFEEVKQEVINTKQYDELKKQLIVAHQENAILRRKLNELLTKIDNVDRKE